MHLIQEEVTYTLVHSIVLTLRKPVLNETRDNTRTLPVWQSCDALMWRANGDQLKHGWFRTELCKSPEQEPSLAVTNPSVAPCQEGVSPHQPAGPFNLHIIG